MSSTSFNTSTPQVLMLGIQDLSTAIPAVQAEQLPSHLPKVYLYAQKGPAGPQLVSPDGAQQLYGPQTFNELSPYCTHQTVLSNLFSKDANAQMIERMFPADMGPKANFLLSLDVLATTVPQYQRNSDGTYVTNSITGLPEPVIPAATNTGYVCKWVVTHITAGGPSVSDDTTFGVATAAAGDQTDGSTTSMRYPILEFWASSYGAYGNNCGFRLSAPTTSSAQGVNSAVLNALKAYPFRISAISRLSATATPTISRMVTGDAAVDFVLQPGAINPYTTAPMSLASVFPNAWGQSGIPGYQDILADLGNLHIYQSNIDLLMGQFATAEITAITGGAAGSDFSAGDTAANSKYLFNFFTGKSSTGAPYYSYAFNTTDTNAVNINDSTNLYASGGSDGTMTEALFAGLVTTAVSEYNNPLSPLMDMALNPESHLYDTGFPLATKQAMTNFIAIRKDTNVILSSYDVNGPAMTEADEAALGAALRTQLQLFPESTYFGTPVVRGTVMARYATMYGTSYPKKLPLTFELAHKSAKLMGASDGRWNPVYLFDTEPNNQLTMFNPKTINVSFTPTSQRNQDWANGINYPIPFSREALFFPGLKTAYSDDTSVLTNYLTACACAHLEKVGVHAWRKYSGNIKLTPAQLCDAVNQSVIDDTTGVFAGLYKIIPAAYISGGDAKNGYSWTLPIKIYANVSDTVMTLSVQAYRMSALAAANGNNTVG